jgi:hypothetical protein
MNLSSAKFKIAKRLARLGLVSAVCVLPFWSFPVAAEVVSAGSSKASTEVDCVPGSMQRNEYNWVRRCILLRPQTFNRVTFQAPGQPATTVPVNCAANIPARFDQYGWLIGCP